MTVRSASLLVAVGVTVGVLGAVDPPDLRAAAGETGYRLRICAQEFPPPIRPHGCGSGIFSLIASYRSIPPLPEPYVEGLWLVFDNVAPARYNFQPGCNPFGCWRPETVTITDHDVDVVLEMVPLSPTAPPGGTWTPTPVVSPTLTPTPSPALRPCVGDENGDGVVTIDEIMQAVDAALHGCTEGQP